MQTGRDSVPMEASEFTANDVHPFIYQVVREPGHREPDPLQVVSRVPVACRLHHQTIRPVHLLSAEQLSRLFVMVAEADRMGTAQNPAQFGLKGFV